MPNLREHWKDGGGPMRATDQHYFILGDDGEPIAVRGVEEWGRWYETADRRVEQTKVGDVEVSTVFLGLNHSFGSGPPLLFETMIFGGPWDQYQWRYTLRSEAEQGHAAIVAKLQTNEEPEP